MASVFEADATEGRTHSDDWIGNSWAGGVADVAGGRAGAAAGHEEFIEFIALDPASWRCRTVDALRR